MSKESFYRKKINDLSELEKEGIIIIDDEDDTIIINLEEILEEKGLLISDLSKLTGISRQSINAVIRKKMKPSIEFVLKISYVLGIKEVDGIFQLSDKAWVMPYYHERDTTMYINLADMTIVDSRQKKKEIDETGFEYFNLESGEKLTKNEHDQRLRTYLKDNIDNKMKELRKEVYLEIKNSGELEKLEKKFNTSPSDPDYPEILEKIINRFQSVNQTKSKATEELKEEFYKKYSKIYKKLGKKIDPYVVQ